MDELAKTPLYETHLALGGKIVPFAGYAMPVQYPGGALREYQHVRGDDGAGLFDISHMGQLRVQGPDASAFLQYATTNDIAALVDGQVQYSALLNEQGTFIDDITVYRLAGDHYYLCVNAANRRRDLSHLREVAAAYDVTLEDESDATALLALQGMRSEACLRSLVDADLSAIGYYRFARIHLHDADGHVCEALVSRTGYTGEDGFEIYLPREAASRVWNALLAAGAKPIGLAARDMLRSEMGYALYGHEISEAVTPVEARLMWITKLQKGEFLGRAAVLARREQGPERVLIGLRLRERGIPREGYPVFVGEQEVGRVSTGQHSPLAGAGIALAYVQPTHADAQDGWAIGIRGRKVPAERCRPPFVRSRVRR